jgi:hypothetical protein
VGTGGEVHRRLRCCVRGDREDREPVVLVGCAGELGKKVRITGLE